jgi:hypothetical protein
MSTGAAFGIAAAGGILGTVVAFVSTRADLGFLPSTLLYAVVLGAAGWATVFLTKASTGKGIVASLVGAAVLAIGTYFAVKAAVSGMVADASTEIAKSAKGATGDAKLNDALNTMGTSMVAAAAAAAAGMIALKNLVLGFLLAMIGNFVGGSMKKSAIGGSAPAVARAA